MLGGLTGLTHHCTHGYDLLQQKRSKQKSKAKGVECKVGGGGAGTIFQRPLPIESHRMCLIPPATELWHVWNVVYHKTSLKMQCQKQTNKNKRCSIREFPGSSVVRTPCFHYQQPGYSTGWGTEIPQATRRAKTVQNKEASCARVVTVDSSRRYILHSRYPNSRFPGRKHVLAQTTLHKHLSHSKQL